MQTLIDETAIKVPIILLNVKHSETEILGGSAVFLFVLSFPLF